MGDRDATLRSAGLDDLENLLVAGGELLRQNKIREARDKFQRALTIDPNNTKALGLMGLACFRMDDFQSALPVYKKLVALKHNDASFALNLGLVHLKLGDPAAAIRELQRSRELDPSQSRAVSYLGLAHARSGEYDKAFQAFLQAGQNDLALEMAQYLTPEQQEQIRATVLPLGRAKPPAMAAKDTTAANAPAAATPPAKDSAPVAKDSAPVAKDSAPVAKDSAPKSEAARGDTRKVEAKDRQSDDGEVAYDVVEFDIDSEDVVLEDAEEESEEPEMSVEASEEADDSDEGFDEASFDASFSASGGDEIEELEGEFELDADAVDEAVTPPRSLRSSAPGAMAKGPGVISRAVEQALPSASATAGAARTAIGHNPPRALSEFATSRLIRPEDGDHTFETSAGGVLIVRVRDKVYSRTEGVYVTGGELAYEVASRRVRGSSTGEDFSSDGRPLFIVSGHGHLIAAPLGEHFTAVTLDDDILYLREDLIFAFEEQVRWENGHVPGSNASIRMVQFRGHGSVAMRSRRPLLAIKLAPESVLHIDAQVLAGWIGRVIPRAVTPVAGGEASALFVECTGEGVILIEEQEPHTDEPALSPLRSEALL